jgi:hypothetical protein
VDLLAQAELDRLGPVARLRKGVAGDVRIHSTMAMPRRPGEPPRVSAATRRSSGAVARITCRCARGCVRPA